MSIDFSRNYKCDCGHIENNAEPSKLKGHWLSPDCPKCSGKMKILPSGVVFFNKGRGSLGKGRKFNNPDGDVAKALRSVKRKAG